MQKPIYYISKALIDAKSRYQTAEKMALALVVAVRKLRPYFQSHPIVVLTNFPLQVILAKPDLSGRLIKWAVELGEFDISYHPRIAIKGQVLVDLIADFVGEDPDTHTVGLLDRSKDYATLVVVGRWSSQ